VRRVPDQMLRVDADLIHIARQIVERDLTEDEWSAHESDAEFQRGKYVGGYDSDEAAFCFAAASPDGNEMWFQLT
jgi:hypothetical protein